MADDVVAVLQRAKERVAEGWCQGAISQRGKVCAFGALLLGEQWRRSPAFYAAFNILRSSLGDDIVHWNNIAGRTQVEVLDAFDAAIRLAKDTA